MVPWRVELYAHDDGESPVEAFINALPTKVRARLRANLDHLAMVGNRAAAPLSKPLGEGLFELRVSLGRMEVRLLYAFFPDRRIVLLHASLKKTRAVSATDIEIARARRHELEEN